MWRAALVILLAGSSVLADRECSANGGKFECRLEEGDIDESLNTLDQDDPVLISAVKNYYLDSPSPLRYNFHRDYKKILGQFRQAYIVDLIYGKEKRDGFFVEAGAYEGQIGSNTLFFELYRGWTGLLVEGGPDNYEKLLEKNRKTWSVGQCLSMSRRPEVVEFDSAGLFGGIMQKDRIRPGDNIPSGSVQHIDEINESRRFIKIQCFPLFTMVAAVGNTTVVDYLSLDIEGAELAVLKSLPWDDSLRVGVISLEICRKKLRPDLEGGFTDDYAETVSYLDSVGFEMWLSFPHTEELICYEAFFVNRDLGLQPSQEFKDMVKRVLEDGAGAEYLADLDLDAAAEGDETHDHHHNEL